MSEYKRLTSWDRGNPYVRECFERTAEEGGCEYMNTQKCIWCEHNLDTIRRLAQYEDSGFSPEQINTLLEKLAEALAGQEGQLTDRQIDAVLNGELKSMLDKLAQYEDIGLSPEQIKNTLLEKLEQAMILGEKWRVKS